MTTPHFDRPTGGDAYARTAGRHIAPRVADAARAAEAFCPISNALRGNVDITLTARLA